MPFINFASVGVIVFLLWRMSRDNGFALVPIFLPFLVLIWDALSVAYLELGAYSPELQFTTRQTGATLRLVFALCCFLATYWATFRRVVSARWLARTPSHAAHEEPLETLLWWMTFGAIGAACVLLALIPPGVVESRSRALLEHPSLVRDKLLQYLPMFGIMLGFAAGATARPRTRFLSYGGFAVHLLTLYLYGNKFSGLISFVFPFALAFAPLLRRVKRDRRVFGIRVSVQIAVASVFLLGMVAMGVYRYFVVLKAEANHYLMTRIFVLQGGVWWFTDYTATHGTYLPGAQRFLDFVVAQKFHPNAGLMYLMSRAIGWDLTQKIFYVNVSLYTGTFPSIYYVLGGVAGPPFLCAVLGVVIGAISGYLTRKVLQFQIYRLLLALSLLLPVFSLLDPGELTQLYTIAFPVKVAAIVLVELVIYTIGVPAAAAPMPAGTCYRQTFVENLCQSKKRLS